MSWSRNLDINFESSFASNQIIYFLHPTKVLLIPQYYNIKSTYGLTCNQNYGSGL